MAARSAWWDNRSSNQTVTSTTDWTTIGRTTALGVAGTSYWVMGFVSYSTDTAAVGIQFDLWHENSLSQLIVRKDNVASVAEVSARAFLIGKLTTPGGGNQIVSMRAKNAAAQTVTVKEATIVVFATATGDQYAADDTTTAGNVTTTYADFVTLSWTAGTNEDYLILAAMELEGFSGSSAAAKGDLYNGTTSYGAPDTNFRTGASQSMAWGQVLKATLSGAQTWKLRYADTNSIASIKARYGRILALKNQASEDMFYAESRTKSTKTTSGYTAKATSTQTAQAVPYLLLGSACIDVSNTTNYVGAELTAAGSAIDAPALWKPSGNNADMAVAYGAIDSASAGSRAWTVSYSAVDAAGTCGIYEASVAAMQLATGATVRPASAKRGRMLGGVGRMMRR